MYKTPETLAWVKSVFDDPTKKVVFHNAKFDLKMFGFEGIDIFSIQAEVNCTLILAKMFNGMLPSYELIWLGQRLVGRDTADKTAIVDWLRENRRAFVAEHGRNPGFQDAPKDLVKRRCLWDVETTLYLFAYLYPKVRKSCWSLYCTERDLMFVVIDMENTGVQVDITRAEELKAEAEAGIEILRKRLNDLTCPFVVQYATCTRKGCRKHKKKIKNPILDCEPTPATCPICGDPVSIVTNEVTEFNSNSSAVQLPVVWEKLGFELRYKTKPKKGKKGGKPTGGGRWSFDEYSMIRYSPTSLAKIIRESGEEGWKLDRFLEAIDEAVDDPREAVPALILKINELKKMISTYYRHIIEEAVDVRVDPLTGRKVGVLHCNFNQSEAMTGRFSSSHPNFQNMPRILGPRECFIPRRGRRNYHIDYSQVEMKFFAHFANDMDMAKAIEDDIHLFVAGEIYNLALDQVSKEQRKRAKGVNFGIIYGSGAPTMAETLTKKGLLTTVREATVLVSNYHRRFPSVRRVTSQLKSELARVGYVTNPFGRRYHIHLKKAYTALNYMCQGTSADLIKAAMVRVWKWLRTNYPEVKIIMQVHDELVLEI